MILENKHYYFHLTQRQLLVPQNDLPIVQNCNITVFFFLRESITIYGPQPCRTQRKYEPFCVGPPKMYGGEFWQNMVHWRREWPSVFLPWEPQTVWKGKKIGNWNMNSPGQQVPNMLLQNSGEITLERMKGWNQSKSNTQLWMWLVLEVVQCYKEQYYIGTWNVRSMNQGKWEVVKRRWQE